MTRATFVSLLLGLFSCQVATAFTANGLFKAACPTVLSAKTQLEDGESLVERRQALAMGVKGGLAVLGIAPMLSSPAYGKVS
jgi:hypothetical protein